MSVARKYGLAGSGFLMMVPFLLLK
jgi:hypothetical protein